MKVLITGGTGMVGSAFRKVATTHDFVFLNRKIADLSIPGQLTEVLNNEKIEAVIHLAAKVGGVKGNTDYVADFYLDNIKINSNVLDECRIFGVKKVVSLLSTCVYPDKVSYPLSEDQIHNGAPHQSNFGYAYAKRMLDVHSRALRNQYGCNFVCAVPNNIYGENDNFDLENGHVIPAIIRKIWEAKISNSVPSFWGDGTPLREFTYSRDIANCLIYVLENYNLPSPVNIGFPKERSISSVVNLVCEYLGYDGELIWDTKKPSGQFRKPSCNKKFIDSGWNNSSYTDFEVGLKNTCNWFINNYPNIRGF